MNLEKWISEYIVSLNLCPFAAGTLKGSKWKVEEVDFKDYKAVETVLNGFLNEDVDVTETYFLKSVQLESWEDFLFYYNFLEDLMSGISAFKAIKIVGFHPKYMHREVSDQHIHFSNRAPWALIQLLKLDDVHKRTVSMDVDKVLEVNELKLKSFTIDELQNKLDECKR
jgi:hypothetical protein